MSDFRPHERAYRSEEVLDKVARFRIAMFGCGAVGSNLAILLARMGFIKFLLIDGDRVNLDNLGSQAYRFEHQGRYKADSLQFILGMLFPPYEMPLPKVHHRHLHSVNDMRRALGYRHYAGDVGLVIDSTDNHAARELVTTFCREWELNCLHVGMNGAYGEVSWNENYQVPQDLEDLPDDCAHPFSITLVYRLAALAAESVLAFVADGEKVNYRIRGTEVSNE